MVVKFPIPAIANLKSSSVIKATLSLYNSMDLSPDYVNSAKSLFKLTRQWKQYEVSWNSSTTASKWTSAGGDYAFSPIATYNKPGYLKWEDFDVTATVKGFIDKPLSNFGFLLKFDNYDTSNFVLYTANENNAEEAIPFHPKLTITFEDGTALKKAGAEKSFASIIFSRSTISLSHNEPVEITIINARGSAIASLRTNETTKQITLPVPLNSGVYYARIRSLATGTNTIRSVLIK